MKTILIGIGVTLVATLLLVLGVGWSLPQAHQARADALFSGDAPPLFDRITNVAAYPEWRSHVDRVELLGSNPIRWREHDGGDAITFEVVEAIPPREWRVRIADRNLPFGGTWTYALAPEANGTRLTITEDGEVYNPLFRFVSRFVIGHTATIETYLADLRRSAGQ